MKNDRSVCSQLHFLVGVSSKNKVIEDYKHKTVATVCVSCNEKHGKPWTHSIRTRGLHFPYQCHHFWKKKAVTNVVQNCNFCNWKHSQGFVILQWWRNTWDFNLWRTAFSYKSESVIWNLETAQGLTFMDLKQMKSKHALNSFPIISSQYKMKMNMQVLNRN